MLPPLPCHSLFTSSLWGVPLRRPPSLPPRRCWKTTSDPSGHRCCRSAAASSSSPSSVVSSGSNRSSSTNLPVLQSKFRLSPFLFLGNLPRHYSHCRVCVGFRGELNCGQSDFNLSAGLPGPTDMGSESDTRTGCCFLRRLLKLPTRTRLLRLTDAAVESGGVP